jgi:pepsin A
MAPLSALLWFSYILFGLVYAAEDSYTIPVYRDVADEDTVNALSAVRKRQSGTVPSVLGHSLYWFGHFSVGDTPDLKLLIDTGSTDLIVNNGLYA